VDRVAGHPEGQAGHHHAAQRFAWDIHPLPERVGAQQDRPFSGPEAVEQDRAIRSPLTEDLDARFGQRASQKRLQVPQHAPRGDQQEGSTSQSPDQVEQTGRDPPGEVRRARVGQTSGHGQQGLAAEVEGAGHHQRLEAFLVGLQAHPALKEVHAAANGQGGRGQDGRAHLGEEELGELGPDVQGDGAQAGVPVGGLGPVDPLQRVGGEAALQALADRLQALREGLGLELQALPGLPVRRLAQAFGDLAQASRGLQEALVEALSGAAHLLSRSAFEPGLVHGDLLDLRRDPFGQQAQHLLGGAPQGGQGGQQSLVHPVHELSARLRVQGGACQGQAQPRQEASLLGQGPGAVELLKEAEEIAPQEAVAQVVGGGLLQVMGLVQDEPLQAGEDPRSSIPPQGQIREQQGMVGQDQVGPLQGPALAEEEAALEEGAALTAAGHRVAGQAGPQALLQGDLRAQSASAVGQVRFHLGQQAVLVGGQLAASGKALHPAQAQVVAPTPGLHGPEDQPQGALQAGDVDVQDLLLQVQGARGHHHRSFATPGSPQQGGDQVGQGLPGSGSGLGQQDPLGFEGLGHGPGHLHLPGAFLEAGDARKALAEEGLDPGAQRGGHGSRASPRAREIRSRRRPPQTVGEPSPAEKSGRARTRKAGPDPGS